MGGAESTGGKPLTLEQAFERATSLLLQGQNHLAEPIYRAILSRDVVHFASLQNLGVALSRLRRFDEAVGFLTRAVRVDPLSAVAQNSLGNALQGLDRFQEALACYERALALDPIYAEAHASRAVALAVLGAYEAARGAIERAIDLAPGRPSFHRIRSTFTSFGQADRYFLALERFAQDRQSLPPEEQICLEFAAAKAHEDVGDLARSFRHQLAGNALKRRTIAYDEAATFAFFDAIADTFDRGFLERHRAPGHPTALPIFIVGMARSGTTLVEQILARHPVVAAGGEHSYFERAVSRVCGGVALPAAIAQIRTRWSGAEFARLGASYLDMLGATPLGATRRTDKMLDNFRLTGLIAMALPQARIVHVRRDPVDTCLSNFATLFAGGQVPHSYDLGELGRYYRAYERLMRHWRDVLPPEAVLELRYEELVADPGRESRRLLAFCGLDWDERCLTFYESKRPVSTASHMQVRRPIYRSSVGRQRPPDQLLQPLLDALAS